MDRDGCTTDRIVWPLLITFLGRKRYLVGWCETKQDYPHFKTERVVDLRVLRQKYPGRRTTLLKG
ncbi:MAG: WYL domain-containing protein [Rhodobacteraceae bacterium]|nr:WYL domain-containing protein [Paracoccaceae bacterium]